tara:strand:- start:924 stop:1331 length:408 start_codon:yes stop_codon:yes gene_type:complete
VKLVICILFVGLSHAHDLGTANDFLNHYPFEKSKENFSKKDYYWKSYYESKILGLGEGNQITLAKLIQQNIIPKNSSAIKDLNTYIRTCEMTPEELIGVIKKWCDTNPNRAHLMFSFIAIEAFLSLPIKQKCFFD